MIEFLIIIIYFFVRIYYILDSKFIYSKNGSKLEKYIKQIVPRSISSNLVEHENKNFNLKSFLSNLVHFLFNKQELKILLITIAILSIKIVFSYKYINSNFFYVKIFSKNIDLVTVFYPNFKYLYIVYLLIYAFCIFDITKLLRNKILANFFIKKDNNFDDEYNNGIVLGKDNFNKDVILNEKGLYQNLLITGSIGTGKTSSAINNILFSLIKNNMSGLVIDIKGNYLETLKNMCNVCNVSDKLIEISLESEFKYNPLDNNLSNVELAHILKKVLSLLSDTNMSDSFWLDKVEGYMRDFITLIRAYNDYPTFYEIHNLINNNEYLNLSLKKVKDNIIKNKFSDEELFNINSALNNIKNEYLKLDERTISIIKAEITRITSIFVSDYKIYDKFCSKSDLLDFYNNKIVVLSIGIGDNSLLAKVISTYLKLEFQRQVLSQKNSYKPLFFVCDEYQEIANKEDAHFFSISREFKCINVVSMQSYSSLINSLKDEVSSRVIIQNLVNKIWFRNSDNYTVSEIIKQIGKEEKKYENLSISESGTNTRYSPFTRKFRDYKTGISKSYNYNLKIDYKYNEEYFTTKLNTFEAVCLISDGNKVSLIDKIKFDIWREENDV